MWLCAAALFRFGCASAVYPISNASESDLVRIEFARPCQSSEYTVGSAQCFKSAWVHPLWCCEHCRGPGQKIAATGFRAYDSIAWNRLIRRKVWRARHVMVIWSFDFLQRATVLFGKGAPKPTSVVNTSSGHDSPRRAHFGDRGCAMRIAICRL